MDQSANTARRRRPTVLEIVAGLFVIVGLVLLGATLLGNSSDEADQSEPTTAGLNTSCYAYRDVNRDGTYDGGDRPYAALRVNGSGPSGTSSSSSNSGGFANFTMLLGGDQAFIDRAGRYTFEAVAPDGWFITSPTAVQEVEFAELEGSPTGLATVGRCTPFGVAPILTITVPPTLQPGSPDDADATVVIESAEGPIDAETADGAAYRATVEPGRYTVRLNSDESTLTRTVEVAVAPVRLSRFTDDVISFDPLPNTAVVTFDEFITANTVIEVPNGTGGLDWSNWVTTHRIFYGAPGYVNTSVSGEYVAYNSSGHPADVSSDEPFDFVAAYVGVAWPEAEQHAVMFRAWRGDDLAYTDTFELTTSGPVYFDADYRSITRLEVSSAANWQVVIDDAAFRTR